MSHIVMRFAGVYLSHNPKALKFTRKNEHSSQRLLSGGRSESTLGDIGSVSGRAELYGESCQSDLHLLQELCAGRADEVLSIPYLGAMRAVLTDLTLAAEPKADYIAVDFVFTAAQGRAVSEIKCAPYYTANSRDNLWDIAYKFGKDVTELVRLNPHIRYINEIEWGERVRLY